MKKGKFEACSVKTLVLNMFLCLSFVSAVQMAFADEGTQTSSGRGPRAWASKVSDKITNATSGWGVTPKIKPHFYASSGFTSDANLGDTINNDHAWIARVAPGITISLPMERLYSEVDYTYGFSSIQGSHTHSNNSTHALNALMRYDLTSDTALGASNNLQLSELPGAGGKLFMLDTAQGQVQHHFSQSLSAELHDVWQWFNSKFSQPPDHRTDEFKDNGFGGSITYNVTPDLDVSPSFNWHVRRFEHFDNKNYWSTEPSLGSSYKLGPKTTVTGNFGWQHLRFTGDKTEDGLSYGGGIQHLYGRKFVGALNYRRSLQSTFDTNFALQNNALATNLDNLDRDFRVIRTHRINSTGTYNFDERNAFNVFSSFLFANTDAEDNVFEKRDNDEKSMEVGGGYSYRINKYLSLDLGYTFGRRFSTENADRGSYTFHKITAGVNVAVSA